MFNVQLTGRMMMCPASKQRREYPHDSPTRNQREASDQPATS
jgi:hypothetical protein